METTPVTPNQRTEELRQLLQNELIERCRKNPRYSLRSFAKQIGLAPSVLSSVMNGKRPITENTVLRISRGLGFNESQRNRFLQGSRRRRPAYRQVEFDRFLVISEWYHFAILELLKIEGFVFTPAAIAAALGITVSQATFALARLERVGLLQKNADGYRDAQGGNGAYIQPDRDHRALRDLQVSFLELAIERLRDTSPELRDNTAVTMAIRADRLPEAKRKLKELRRAFAAELESGDGKDAVYQLVVGFYPLSKPTKRSNV